MKNNYLTLKVYHQLRDKKHCGTFVSSIINQHFKSQIYLSDESDQVQGAKDNKKFTENYGIFISSSLFPLIMFENLLYYRKMNSNMNFIKNSFIYYF